MSGLQNINSIVIGGAHLHTKENMMNRTNMMAQMGNKIFRRHDANDERILVVFF